MESGLLFIGLLYLISGLWTAASAAESSNIVCPIGWTQFHKMCYMFHRTEKDWADGEAVCINLGGNLASLHTADDYNFIRAIIFRVTGHHKSTWVGGYDAVKEGHWQWSDGSKFKFTNWAQGQPNNLFKKQHCMEINDYGRDYVNDAYCYKKKSFMCARKL